MTAAFNSAPPLGAPPTIEWISVDRLQVDPAYQRSIVDNKSERLIVAMARGWDWRLFQPLACARRGDDAVFVIDGQHRLVSARRRGDLPHLPCVVSRYESPAHEAAAFAAMNRQRKAISRLEVYRAAIAGGDAKAVAALAAITAAGLSLAPHENAQHWQPRQIACVGGVVRLIGQHGARITVDAMIALAEAYPDEPLQYFGTLLPAVAAIYAAPPAGFDPDRLIATLEAQMQDEWRAAGVAWAEASGSAGQITRGVQSAVLAAYQRVPQRRAA